MTIISRLLRTFALVLATFIIIIISYALSPSDRYLKNRVVKLLGDHGQCTGEQVKAPSGKMYILTAGHCKGLQEAGFILAVDEAGKTYKVKVIDEDPNADLLLLEGIPGLSGLSVARNILRSEHVRTYTHGGGMDTYRTDGDVIGTYEQDGMLAPILTEEQRLECILFPKNKVYHYQYGTACILHTPFTVTTAMIIPGSSGGPVVNVFGQLIGVVSATDGHMSSLVTLSDIHTFLAKF
jgi:hypothetical protein